MRPPRIEPGPGQESVWDYPRPPRLEEVPARLQVVLGGVTIADSISGLRVCETASPPTFYLPPDDVDADVLELTTSSSTCEWKGRAAYFTVTSGDRREVDAAWCYPRPNPAYRALAGYVSFYAGRMDACFVDDERVVPQPGDYYGGWVTSAVVGPFKGAAGTLGW
jgi:uncharacterized protein (DUF427 family)